MLVLWVVTPCGLVGGYKLFGGTYYLHSSPEDGGSMFLRNVGICLQVTTQRTNIDMKMTAFWDVAPCSLIEVYGRFRGAYCLHHQGDETS
jgi:hypothetical protein